MEPHVDIRLTASEALVLYGWITRFNERDDIEFADQAEQRVLWNLEASLEERLVEPFNSNYQKLLEDARNRVRDPVD